MAVSLILCSLTSFSQRKADYEPLSKSQQADINSIIVANSVSSFFVNDCLPIGPINLTNFLNIVSYNPVEGTRIRLSAETNDKMFAGNKFLRNRLAFSGMVAYGTKDNEIKYAVGAAFNFAKKPRGVYGFPCSTLTINWEDNTYMPSSPNYDVAYFSFGDWDRFYFAKKKQLTVSFLKEFSSYFAIRPYVYWQKIDSYMLYDNGYTVEQLDPAYDYINKAGGITLSYTPKSQKGEALNILNSRFYSLPTQIMVDYSYNRREYKSTHDYSRLEASVQHRFQFLPMCLDLKLTGGAILGNSGRFMRFTPNYRVSSVSNIFGFNLYSPNELSFSSYLQTFTQLNFGGLLLDNIKYLKQFRPNEFINFKALFTEYEDIYCEVGVGIDHILGFLGFEFVKRLSQDNPYGMPEWAIKIRCTL